MTQTWTQRIVNELRRAESETSRQLVLFNDLAISMLGNRNSREGLDWLAAARELQRRGWIRVDRAGYVALQAPGRLPAAQSAQR